MSNLLLPGSRAGTLGYSTYLRKLFADGLGPLMPLDLDLDPPEGVGNLLRPLRIPFGCIRRPDGGLDIPSLLLNLLFEGWASIEGTMSIGTSWLSIMVSWPWERAFMR